MEKMPDPPPGYRNGIFCAALPSGQMQVCMVRNGKTVNYVNMQPSQAADIAFSALAIAQHLHQRSGSPLPESGRYPIIQGCKLSLHPDSGPAGHSYCLVVQCGEAMVGFSIPDTDLRKVAAGTLLAGASVEKPQ